MEPGAHDGDSTVVASPRIDESRDVLRRAPGCAVGFIGFIVIFAFAEPLTHFVPALALDAVAVVAGLGILWAVGSVSRRLWSVEAPDPVQLLLGDLTSITRRSVRDFRVSLPVGTPVSHRLLHELLYSSKWMGTLLVFLGLGSVLYHLMLALELQIGRAHV